MTDNTDIDRINPDLLPYATRPFVALIGLAETLKLLQSHGGLPVKFTCTCAWLKGVLTDDSIRLLAEHFNGQEISLPKYDKAFLQLRNIGIIESINNGQSGRQVAKQNGLTYRMVKLIKNKQPDENPTGDLFS